LTKLLKLLSQFDELEDPSAQSSPPTVQNLAADTHLPTLERIGEKTPADWPSIGLVKIMQRQTEKKQWKNYS